MSHGSTQASADIVYDIKNHTVTVLHIPIEGRKLYQYDPADNHMSELAM